MFLDIEFTEDEVNAIYELIQVFDQSKLDEKTLIILENLFEKLDKKLT